VKPVTDLSLYVHFPFCVHRCAYCDFNAFAAARVPRKAYAAALLREFELRLADLDATSARVRTIYFGGGTPSLWGPRGIGEFLDAIATRVLFDTTAEITVEVNPGTLERGSLRGFATAGVNRVSMGVQSFDAQRLRALDRVHGSDEALAAARQLARLIASGALRSASIDLIHGGFDQTVEDFHRDVDRFLSLDLPHLSAYGLTVEAGTPLHARVARAEAPIPDEATQAEILRELPEWLTPAGIARYEVSNHARAGHESHHNRAYWHGAPYLAIGAGAHGFLTRDLARTRTDDIGIRYGNLRSVPSYLAAIERGRLPEEFRERIDARTHAMERILTGLRTVEGVDLDSLARACGAEARVRVLERADRRMRLHADVVLVQDRLFVRPESFVFLDAIIRDLV